MTAKKGGANGAVVVDPARDDVVLVHLDDLTVGEITDAEELSGRPISDIMDPEKPKGRMFQAVGCVVKRRTVPDFTWEQARNLKVFLRDSPVEVPPTNGRVSSTRSRSPRTSA